MLSKVKYNLVYVINVISKCRCYVLHLMFHAKRKQFPYFECDYKSYKLHTEAYHTGQNVFKCIQCENERNLLHEVFHIGKKPLSCSECDYRFYYLYKSFLKNQQTGKKPFSYSECDQTSCQLVKPGHKGPIFIFYEHSSNVHMILHTGKNPLFWFRSNYSYRSYHLYIIAIRELNNYGYISEMYITCILLLENGTLRTLHSAQRI